MWVAGPRDGIRYGPSGQCFGCQNAISPAPGTHRLARRRVKLTVQGMAERTANMGTSVDDTGAAGGDIRAPQSAGPAPVTASAEGGDAGVRRGDVRPETWAILAGRPAPEPGSPLNTPIVAASTYVLGGERIYTRNESTHGWESFEAMLGGLEGGEAVAFSSGMAACAAVLGQLPAGAHLVLVDDCYQGVAGIAEAGARTYGWLVERLAATDGRWPERAGEADLLWLESPSNPLLEVADLGTICAAPRRPGTPGLVANT